MNWLAEHHRPSSQAASSPDGDLHHALARFSPTGCGDGLSGGTPKAHRLCALRERPVLRTMPLLGKLYVLNFGIGVASGLADGSSVRHQLGAPFAEFASVIFFGSVLGFFGGGDGLHAREPVFLRDHAVRLDAGAAAMATSSPTVRWPFGAKPLGGSWISAPTPGCTTHSGHHAPWSLPGAELFAAINNPFKGQREWVIPWP